MFNPWHCWLTYLFASSCKNALTTTNMGQLHRSKLFQHSATAVFLTWMIWSPHFVLSAYIVHSIRTCGHPFPARMMSPALAHVMIGYDLQHSLYGYYWPSRKLAISCFRFFTLANSSCFRFARVNYPYRLDFPGFSSKLTHGILILVKLSLFNLLLTNYQKLHSSKVPPKSFSLS